MIKLIYAIYVILLIILILIIFNKFENFNIIDQKINPIIFCIAKLESDYIEEFVKYHLALGFSHIYIYDNEDTPTYSNILKKYNDNITVIHFPGKGKQNDSLIHFKNNFMYKNDITHAINIDVDEFIVLKKHDNIIDFIKEYIVSDNNCAGIGINWRFFGSSGLTEKTNTPLTIKFTKCGPGDQHIKTLFEVKSFKSFINMHCIDLNNNKNIKSTNNKIIVGPFSNPPDISVIQINHYKTKTLPEFMNIRTRGYADKIVDIKEDIMHNFNFHNRNDFEDKTAHDFYIKKFGI